MLVLLSLLTIGLHNVTLLRVITQKRGRDKEQSTKREKAKITVRRIAKAISLRKMERE